VQLDEGCESGVDFTFGAGLQDMELHLLCAGRSLHFSRRALGRRIVWVREQGDHPRLGNQLGKQLKQLGCQIGGDVAEARQVAAWPGETGHETNPDRIADGSEDNRDRRGCVFRR